MAWSIGQLLELTGGAISREAGIVILDEQSNSHENVASESTMTAPCASTVPAERQYHELQRTPYPDRCDRSDRETAQYMASCVYRLTAIDAPCE